MPTPVHNPTTLDRYLGSHPAGLKLGAQRMELLAKNLANADTPNYKARDVDFRAAMASAAGNAGDQRAPLRLATTNARHEQAADVATGIPDLKYRVPLAPALDGNTVDVQLEQAAFAENAVRYQASLTFLSAKFRGLLTAITGE